MRPMKKAYVSFGMVTIPVNVYAATENRDVSFNQLHKECHNRIRYQKYCPHCDKVVQGGEIEKGVETSPGEFVIFSEAELAELEAEDTRSIRIVNFIDLSEVDPLYYEKAYYLEPADVGHKPFELLKIALERGGRAALAKVALRQKEILALLRPANGTICMNLLHWPDEVRSTEHLVEMEKDPHVDEKEIEMALMLIDNLTTSFDPSAYEDERRNAILSKISARAAKKVAPSLQPAGEQIVDLMKALEASIEATKAKGKTVISTKTSQARESSHGKKKGA